MTNPNSTTDRKSEPSQIEKFKEAARQLECDEDPAHWDDALKKVVKPVVPKVEKPE